MGWFSKKSKSTGDRSVTAPLAGKVVSISEVKDEVFSKEIMGKGLGIVGKDNLLVAPVSGTIVTFFPTKHAIGIQTDDGLELLIHVGVDTVQLNGEHFKALKEQGNTVKRGEPLLEVDFAKVAEAGYDTTVILVVTNTPDQPDLTMNYGDVAVGDKIMTY